MNEYAVQLDPRNVLWLNVPRNLARLSIRTHVRMYVELSDPTDDLARAALWDAVIAYATEWRGTYDAPPLEIRADVRA